VKHDPLPPPPPSGASVEVLAPAERRRVGPVGAMLAAGALLATGAWLSEQLRPVGQHPSIAGPVAGLLAVGPQLPPVLLPAAVVVGPATPPAQGQGPVIELAFVMDTTGSMGGLIRAAKQKVWGIVNELADARPRPTIRLGLVAYRDHGDSYVTRVVPLTEDLDAFFEQLQGLKARGGGDTPEAVDEGLAVALDQLGWSQDQAIVNPWTSGLEGAGPGSAPGHISSVRLAFLLGDAPPHDERRVACVELAQRFAARGVRLNTVQLGDAEMGTVWKGLELWSGIAAQGGGEFFRLDQRARTVSVETPQDDAIVAVQQQIEQTVLAYGLQAQQRATRRQWLGISSLSREAYSSRASAQCKTGRTYAGDLIQALGDGTVASLADLDEAQLPEELRGLKPSARAARVAELQQRRAELHAQLSALVVERDAWLRSGAGRARDTFDRKVLDCLRRQLNAGGFVFGC